MRKKIGLAALAVLFVLAMLSWPEVPVWKSGGTDAVAMTPVGRRDGTSLCPCPGGALALRGDSHLLGICMNETLDVTLWRIHRSCSASSTRAFASMRAESEGLPRQWQTTLTQSAHKGCGVLLTFGINDVTVRGSIAATPGPPRANPT